MHRTDSSYHVISLSWNSLPLCPTGLTWLKPVSSGPALLFFDPEPSVVLALSQMDKEEGGPRASHLSAQHPL